jgi:putative heme-binding domain-containing protein
MILLTDPFVPFVACLVFLAPALHAAEPWSDERLPVREGLELWYDCSRQNAGRSSLELPPLGAGDSVDYLIDGSGHGRHLGQPRPEARPRFRQEFNGAFLSFDGEDDALSASPLRREMTNTTVFIVAAPRSNGGNFRAFLGMSQIGRNDYTTGLNLDFGPQASALLSFVNAEGSGFNGAVQLMRGSGLAWGSWHVLALESQAGPGAVRFFIDGKAPGTRDRQDSVIRLDEFVLGARHYSNTREPPHVQGFFHGDIAECVLYSRALKDAEKAAVENYLKAKYGLLLRRPSDLPDESKLLVAVTNPPVVQLLVPGFKARELPLSLKNINNVKYRSDGKLVAPGYNGQIYLLNDTDNDGVEDHVDLFWTNNTIRSPIGMALTPPGYPRGQGVFVAAKGKVSLIVDTNGDDHADQEIVVAEGWKELSHGVDALGVAVDPEGNIFFGLGTASFTEAYQVDKATGLSHYDLKSERGTILKVSSDFQHREIVCTGIRFSVALAFNRAGDLFCTDQEGATWLPNGNPFDELLHIEPGRHYGFPPRHPNYLPGVTDEPSVFDYAPQHQSTCGLNFNDPVIGGNGFGPNWWSGDAIVCGYSRGKIWRTKLVKTPVGYVAQSQLIASLTALTVDACISPQGDLLVATHGGEPDWGSGPDGEGHLYKIRYTENDAPQPLMVWSQSPSEIRIAFDRSLDPETLKGLAKRVDITQGKYVGAGDRFEVKRPGYAVVYNQLGAPRDRVPVQSVGLAPDLRTLILNTTPLQAAVRYAVTLSGFQRSVPSPAGFIAQHPDVDLLTDLTGLQVDWRSRDASPAGGAMRAAEWEGWLPHLDLDVARTFTRGSTGHESLWPQLRQAGTLTLRGQVDLWQMLQPALQPGSKLDYQRPIERVTIIFSAAAPFSVRSGNSMVASEAASDGGHQASWKLDGQQEWIPFELSLSTDATPPRLTAAWFTTDDPRPRAFPLRRFLLPWARANAEPGSTSTGRPLKELAGGNWRSGERIFYGDSVACHKCHAIRGKGNRVGPDLSNLIHRDYASVLKDIREPNAALNPDHLAYNIQLSDGEEMTAILQTDTREQFTVVDATGRAAALAKSRVKSIQPATHSLMPEGLDKALTPAQLASLMTFLLTVPLEPAPREIAGEPAQRKGAEIDAVLNPNARNSGQSAASSFHIVLCAGPKDHGPGEHDYPLWQKRWARLLALAEGVTVSTAWEWPAAEQWQTAQAIVFYSDNPGWSMSRADELGTFLARGGGAVFVHWAVDGHEKVEALAQYTGLAWRSGFSKFRHGPLNLKIEPSAFTAGFGPLNFVDESYWNLVGNLDGAQLIASSVEDGEPRPQMWARTIGKGRVFVSLPGHYTWTFDDPLFRVLLLRGICWAGGQPIDRLSELAPVGARVEE